MKCKVCGAELKKDGDICNKCYEKLVKEEEMNVDQKVLYTLKMKYIPGYEIFKIGDYLIFGIILLLALISTKQMQAFIVALVFIVAFILIMLRMKKIKAQKTTCTFYETKIVYKSKNREKTILYKDVKDVGYYETFSQKLFKLGDIRIYPENGIFITSGINIENVKNVKEEFEKIREVVKNQIQANSEI